jgi:hypothetical protein
MLKKLAVTIAISALACATSASIALAKHHAQHTAAAPAQAQTIPGVNPMTNAAPATAVANPQSYAAAPGVNPMSNAPPTPAVGNPQPYTKVPGVNPM